MILTRGHLLNLCGLYVWNT